MISKRFLLIICIILVLSLFLQKIKNPTDSLRQESVPLEKSEIAKIKATTNLDEQVKLYKELIVRVGVEQAQEDLYRSGLPFDGQTHLLNHEVGDYLYDTYGTKGLIYCKEYFLSSCYHGFVIRAVADGGLQALKEVMSECFKKANYIGIQCSHAIGHGLLAWNGYKNLPKALRDCDALLKQIDHFPLYNCHDGVFMENIWAVHEGGKPSVERWVRDTDPIYPCNAPDIEEKYKNACWSNQPMILYRMFGGNLEKAGEICLDLGNPTYQKTCFDGLARQIHPLTNGSVSETFRLCSFMPYVWQTPCVVSIVKAAFGVGDREIPFSLCSTIKEEGKKSCYGGLIDVIKGYTTFGTQRQGLCSKIPALYRYDVCKDSS